VRENFDLRPAAIIQSLNLKRPIYRPTAAYGHFGRPAAGELFTWERTDKVDALKRSASMK
jgi:S-adenosylmethionine synthetase